MARGGSDILRDEEGHCRCWWCGDDPLYRAYHDTEWGFPVTDDNRLFEKLALEGFQCGLAWITILRKRQNFRDAFDGFDIDTVASYGRRRVNALLKNAGIVRHRGKIEAAISNARAARAMIEERGSLGRYFLDPCAAAPLRRRKPRTRHDLPATTELSTAISRDLRKRGWRFVGPTTVYAFMQSVGLVNDHLVGCAVREAADAARKAAGFPA